MTRFFLFAISIYFFSCTTNQNSNKVVFDLDFLQTYNSNLKNGEKIFNLYCITCHLYGTSGATLIHEKESWIRLLNNKKKEEIFLNVLNGYTGENGPMPNNGGCYSCSNQDLFDAIEYILSINNLSISR